MVLADRDQPRHRPFDEVQEPTSSLGVVQPKVGAAVRGTPEQPVGLGELLRLPGEGAQEGIT